MRFFVREEGGLLSVPCVDFLKPRRDPALSPGGFGALFIGRFRRGANGLEPAADVHLGVSFAAVMAGVLRVGGFSVPSVHGKRGISTLNHEPASGVTGHKSADFTSEFLYGRHLYKV